MPTTVDRDRVLQLIQAGAQLVEVLSRHEYDEEHRPDAIHLPLGSLGPRTAAVLDQADRNPPTCAPDTRVGDREVAATSPEGRLRGVLRRS